MLQWFLTSSVLTAAVLLLRLMLKDRISVRLRYALWALVLVRLLIPGTLGETHYSILNLLPSSGLTAGEGQNAPTYSPSPSDSIMDPYGQDVLLYGQENTTSGQTPAQTGSLSTDSPKEQASSDISKGLSTAFPIRTMFVRESAALIFLLGSMVCAGILLFSNLTFFHRLKKSRIPLQDDGRTAADVWSRMRRASAGKIPPVYESGEVTSPCLYGLFRPAVYLPPRLSEDETALTYVLAHEFIHRRHLDHIWAILRSLTLVLHWYNPLVWLSARLSKKDAELFCDEATVNSLGEEHRTEYGRTLVRMATQKTETGSLFGCSTAMKLSSSELAGRIQTLTAKPRTTKWAALVLLFTLTCTTGCSFLGPAETAESATKASGAKESDSPYGSVSSAEDILTESISGLDETQLKTIMKYLETMRTEYESASGIPTSKLQVTEAEDMTAGTVSENNGIFLTRIHCRFKQESSKPEDNEEELWLTPDEEELPILVWFEDLRIPQPVLLGWHTAREVEEEYGGSYEQAAMDWYEASGLMAYNPLTLLLRPLFTTKDDVTIGMVVESDMVFPSYELEQSWFLSNASDFFDFTFTPLAKTDSLESLWNNAPFYLSLSSPAASEEFVFFGDSNILCILNDQERSYYEYAANDSTEDLPDPLEFLQQRYFSLEMSYKNIACSDSGDLEDIASRFLQLRGEQLLGLSPLNPSDVTRFEICSGPEILEKSEDGKRFTFRCEYALQVEDSLDSIWWSGSAVPGEGKWKDWIIHYCEARLELSDDGLWRCTQQGTGGISLE